MAAFSRFSWPCLVLAALAGCVLFPVSSLRADVGVGTRLEPAAVAKIIDQRVREKLTESKVQASSLASDAEFLRRLHLDLVGVIPLAEEVESFLKSTDPNKRSRVIDELLANPRFGSSLAETWTNLLVPRDPENRRLDQKPLHSWLTEKFNGNASLDRVVHELLTATGTQAQSPAVTYFIGNQALDRLTDNVSRTFLGVQLQCAQCHDHPFTDWKKKEYWGMAAFFINVRASNPEKKGNNAGPILISEAPRGQKDKKGLPEATMFVPAKFLGAAQPKLNQGDPARPALADWLVSPKNPYFARAMVNRVWYQLFGRGLVNPVDDMHADNGASHPELLDALTEQFKVSGFDVKHLLRSICNSETYQRTSRPLPGKASDHTLYQHAAVRAMSPEQLYDSLAQIASNKPEDRTRGKPNPKTGGPGGREGFLTFLRVEEGVKPLEYQAGIPEALRFFNVNSTTTPPAALAQAVKAGGSDHAKVIEQLYLMTLSRLPDAEEAQYMLRHLQAAADARTAYSNVLWALINCSEFRFNH